MFGKRKWPFKDPKKLMVITSKQVVHERNPILYVTHDLEDGMWQFHDGSDVSEDDAMILTLEEVVGIDSSLQMLADLPLGWCAWRRSQDEAWTKQKHEE